MNTGHTISPLQTPATPERGFLTSLQRLINTAGLVSVDLTDTMFAAMPRRDDAPNEAVMPPSFSKRNPAASAQRTSGHFPRSDIPTASETVP